MFAHILTDVNDETLVQSNWECFSGESLSRYKVVKKFLSTLTTDDLFILKTLVRGRKNKHILWIEKDCELSTLPDQLRREIERNVVFISEDGFVALKSADVNPPLTFVNLEDHPNAIYLDFHSSHKFNPQDPFGIDGEQKIPAKYVIDDDGNVIPFEQVLEKVEITQENWNDIADLVKAIGNKEIVKSLRNEMIKKGVFEFDD